MEDVCESPQGGMKQDSFIGGDKHKMTLNFGLTGYFRNILMTLSLIHLQFLPMTSSISMDTQEVTDRGTPDQEVNNITTSEVASYEVLATPESNRDDTAVVRQLPPN